VIEEKGPVKQFAGLFVGLKLKLSKTVIWEQLSLLIC
jgi:hypothetical protein